MYHYAIRYLLLKMKFLLFVLCTIALANAMNATAAGNCRPEIIFDASILLIGDTILTSLNASTPIQQVGLTNLLTYCTNFYMTMYGLSTKKWWLGQGPIPGGMMAYARTNFDYRIYGMETPEFPNNFPMTNGMVLDDMLMLYFSEPATLGGTWAAMQQAMGMPPMVDAGQYILCGEYRGFQNDTRGVKPMFPNIMYASEPMMPMWMGMMGDLTNADYSIMNNITSSLWGSGVSIGLASIRPLPQGKIKFTTRNFLTFPTNTFTRVGYPKYTTCRNTKV